VASVKLKQTGFDGGGAPQSPQQARQPKDQLSFNGGLRVIVGGHGHLKRRIVLSVFQRRDYGLSRQAVTHGVLARPCLALVGDGTGAQTRIAAVGLNLPERTHPPSGRTTGFVSSF
jgi:hypothetical protein